VGYVLSIARLRRVTSLGDSRGIRRKSRRIGLHAFRHTLSSILLDVAAPTVAERRSHDTQGDTGLVPISEAVAILVLRTERGRLRIIHAMLHWRQRSQICEYRRQIIIAEVAVERIRHGAVECARSHSQCEWSG
jgi:integrase